jgi:hypothetical protein
LDAQLAAVVQTFAEKNHDMGRANAKVGEGLYKLNAQLRSTA